MLKKQLWGIGASDGMGLGRAYFLETPKIFDDDSMISLDDEENELEKVIEAVKRLNVRFDNKINAMKQEGKIREAEYLLMDQSILNDSIFQESVAELIEQEHSAVSAISLAMKKQISFMEKMDNPFIKQCIPKLKDVGKRLLYEISGYKYPDLSTLTEDIILFGEEVPVSILIGAAHQHIKGIVTLHGGRTSHTAIMVRNMEIPAIVGCQGLLENIKIGEMLFIDGKKGIVIHNLTESDIENAIRQILEFSHEKQILKEYAQKQTVTKDGKKLCIYANVFDVKSEKRLKKVGAEGIGLFRTDFLYAEGEMLPTEEEQFLIYKSAIKQIGEKPIVIRTLDSGGDKSVGYSNWQEEINPFLGFRAIRICLERPDIFITQLKAILRASVYGNVRIMLPMISNAEEVKRSLEILEMAKQQLKKEGKQYKEKIPFGIMIEVPSAAVMADSLIKLVDFFSIGTNDLTQYVLAADRMNAKVAYKYNYFEPSILRLVAYIAKAAQKAGKPCHICGEMGSDLVSIPFLVGIGITEFSVTPPTVLQTRKAISKVDSKKAKEMAEKALALDTLEEVVELFHQYNK